MAHTTQITESSSIEENTAEISTKSSHDHLGHDHLDQVDPFLTKLFGEYDFNRYGIIGVLIVLVACTGGVAIAFGGMKYPFEVAVLVVPTLANLVLVLAVAPMKLILYSGMVSFLISLTAIIAHILA